MTKVNVGQRTTQPTEATSARKIQLPVGSEQELPEGDEEDESGRNNGTGDQNQVHLVKPLNLLSSNLPDNPRKAAIVLAARQKNHRPLPDLMLESRDVLIPRNWNQPEASAVTVETTKAKGPTSCTKRTVVRLLPEGESVIERRPNVMELAIKWDVSSPPSSAGTRMMKAKLAAASAKPVEKTLEWLYDAPVVHRSTSRPDLKRHPITNSSTNQAQRPILPDSGNGSSRSKDSLTSVRNHQCPVENSEMADSNRNNPAGFASDPESGYNSPRWANGEPNKVALADLDEPVKNTYRSAVSSANPPKNHFVVSTSAFGSNMNNRNEPVMLPEYPLQRRSPIHQIVTSKPLPVEIQKVQQSKCPLNEYPPQHMESTTSAHYRPRESHQHQHQQHQHQHQHQHQSDRDSGIGDLHDRNEDEEEEYEDEDGNREQQSRQHSGQLRRSRSRPCLACHSPPPANKTNRPKNHGKVPYKQAMKAGNPAVKNHTDLEKVIQRRQSYRAPKPAPLSSHARHIRGTLAPPLSAGIGNEPIVDYPDFKRLDSTYRLSYGAHTQQQHQRRRPKTLTAILNEKNCRQWRS